MNLWQRFTKFFEKIFGRKKVPELQEAKILEKELEKNEEFIAVLSNFQRQQELRIVPKIRFEELSYAIKSYLKEQRQTFDSNIQMSLTHEKIKNGTGYIGDEPFECYKRILSDKNREGTTIVSTNRYVNLITTKGDATSDKCTYQEKNQKPNGEKADFIVTQVDENIYQIVQIRAKGDILFREGSEMATETIGGIVDEFIDYAQPSKDEDKVKAYLEATKLPQINSTSDLRKADFKEPFPYVISIEARKLETVDIIYKQTQLKKLVKYLYDGQQAYAKGEKPYMVYVLRNRWT